MNVTEFLMADTENHVSYIGADSHGDLLSYANMMARNDKTIIVLCYDEATKSWTIADVDGFCCRNLALDELQDLLTHTP